MGANLWDRPPTDVDLTFDKSVHQAPVDVPAVELTVTPLERATDGSKHPEGRSIGSARDRTHADPQTQGKIKRFHQTLQRWLAARPRPGSIAELQRQLHAFEAHYNEHRPHRALHRRTPGDAYRAIPKAVPAGSTAQDHYRLRYDRSTPKAG